MTPEAPLRLLLDSAALVENWRRLNSLSGKARAGAAVKSDAYGMGARRVTRELAQAGCRDFFVAYAGEAAELDGVIDPAMLSVLHGPLNDADCGYLKTKGIRPTLNSLEQAQRWLAAGGGSCDLMVDTGINRLGLPLAELGNELISQLQIHTLMSHLASADEDAPLNAQQRARWTEARSLVKARDYSLANSAGIVLGAEYHGTLTRPGLSIYGGVPRPELAGEIVQVARPQAAIMQVRDLEPGESVGYNSTFTATGPLRIGVVAIGYADGYLRCWSGKGMLRSNEGAAAPVIGRVSMDMTVVDLAAAPHLKPGDWLEVAYDLPQSAQVSGLSQYELLTLLGRRFAKS